MLDHPTHALLREMKLDGMAEAFEELQAQDATVDLSHAEWLGLLIDREAANRTTKRFQTRMRAAKLRHVGAAMSGPPSRMSITRRRESSTNLSSKAWLLVAGLLRREIF